jgi:cation:H+ antiporter
LRGWIEQDDRWVYTSDVIISVAALLTGLALLAWAADQLVLGAIRLAIALRVSAVLIGALVIGVGTSAPEILISALAAAEGSVSIAAGNIVGSNIANVALVIGVAALIAPLRVSSHALRRQAPLSAFAVIAFAIALQGGLTLLSGVLLLLAVPLVLGWIVRSADRERAEAEAEAQAVASSDTRLRSEVIRTVLALLGIAAGAQLVVTGAERITLEAGLDEGFVGLTLVAVGTSLPELVTAIQAARRRQPDLIVGNVLGSNVFNSLLAGGLIAVIAPGRLADPALTGLAAIAMVATALVTWLFLASDKQLTRREGTLLLGGYLALLAVLAR